VEAFKTIVNPRSPYYSRLIQSIYSQQTQPSQDYSYEYGNEIGFDRGLRTVFDRVNSIIVCLFYLLMVFSDRFLKHMVH
jgi:hypothetical protein